MAVISCPNCLAGEFKNEQRRRSRRRWFICATCEHVWCETVAPFRSSEHSPTHRSSNEHKSMALERNDAEERLFRIDRMLEHLQKQRDELGEVVEQSRNRRDKNPDGRFPMPHGDAGRGLGEL